MVFLVFVMAEWTEDVNEEGRRDEKVHTDEDIKCRRTLLKNSMTLLNPEDILSISRGTYSINLYRRRLLEGNGGVQGNGYGEEEVGDDYPDKSNIWFNMAISWSDFISRPSDTSSGRQISTLLTLIG